MFKDRSGLGLNLLNGGDFAGLVRIAGFRQLLASGAPARLTGSLHRWGVLSTSSQELLMSWIELGAFVSTKRGAWSARPDSA